MRPISRAALVCMLAAGVAPRAQADEQEAKAVIDKAIKALGGEEKLSGIKAFTGNGKGTIALGDMEFEFTYKMTAEGIRRYRSQYEGEAGGTKFEGATVIDGDKGWKKNDGEVTALDKDRLAIERRNAYLDVVPILLLPLKGEGFKLDSAAGEKVDGKDVAVVRVTGPEGKDFTLYFSKESGLPVKLSGVVPDDEGQEEVQEQTFEEYKEFEGIKVSTRSRITRGGKRFLEVEGLEFRKLAEVEPGAFAEPK